MLIVNPRKFWWGVVMALGFLAVLALMFTPVFGGHNAFRAADRLFNSIAKGSSYYMDTLRAEVVTPNRGRPFDLSLSFKDEETAERFGSLLKGSGGEGTLEQLQVSARGDLGAVMATALEDAEDMFYNRGTEVAERRGCPEKQALLAWWSGFKAMQKALEERGEFSQAADVHEVVGKGLEVGYNFYGIEPLRASHNLLVLTGALVFYIVYTMWWGFAMLFLFDGVGMEMKAGAKKEV